MGFNEYKLAVNDMIKKGELSEMSVGENLTKKILGDSDYKGQRKFDITNEHRKFLKQKLHKSNSYYKIDRYLYDEGKNYMIFEEKKYNLSINKQVSLDQIHNYSVVLSSKYNVTCAALFNGSKLSVYAANREGIGAEIMTLDMNDEDHYNRFQKLLKSNDFTVNNLITILRYGG